MQYAGYVNPTAIGINPGPENTMTVSTKTSSKAHQPAKSVSTQNHKASNSSRNSYRGIVNRTAKKGYRSDLRAEAVARASAIKRSQRSKQSKSHPVKLRGGRKRKAEAAGEKA